MFTGIVKEVGTVRETARRPDRVVFAIDSAALAPVAVGDSVAVNGVCLTVVRKYPRGAFFDVILHTFNATGLKALEHGARVNIETSLKSGESIGGHFMSGHIDCIGKVRDIVNRSGEVSFEIEIPPSFSGLIVEKGSIAVDGVSLTVASVSGCRFRVYIIPHTMRQTTLVLKRSGDGLNIEFDLLGKYAARHHDQGAGKKPLSEEYLKEKGFS